MKIACVLSLGILAMGSFVIPAGYATEAAGMSLVDEFVEVCVNQGPDPDLIEASLAARGAKKKPSSEAGAASGMPSLKRYEEKRVGNAYLIALDENGMCSVSQAGANLPRTEAGFKEVIGKADSHFRISRTQDTRRRGNGRLVAGYLFETKNDTPAFKIVLTAYKRTTGEEVLFITRYYVHF
jgi:hypothetical protein